MPMLTVALFTIARKMDEPRCPSTNGWIMKIQYIYIMQYYPAAKSENSWK